MAAHCEMSNVEQVVGGLAHGGHHHHRTPLQSRLHDPSNALDGFGGFDGRAAEFHDDHWLINLGAFERV